VSAAIGVVDCNHNISYCSGQYGQMLSSYCPMAQLSLSVHRADNALNFAFVQLDAPFRISPETQYTSIHIGRYISIYASGSFFPSSSGESSSPSIITLLPSTPFSTSGISDSIYSLSLPTSVTVFRFFIHLG
jgi:hypothetical protein